MPFFFVGCTPVGNPYFESVTTRTQEEDDQICEPKLVSSSSASGLSQFGDIREYMQTASRPDQFLAHKKDTHTRNRLKRLHCGSTPNKHYPQESNRPFQESTTAAMVRFPVVLLQLLLLVAHNFPPTAWARLSTHNKHDTPRNCVVSHTSNHHETVASVKHSAEQSFLLRFF